MINLLPELYKKAFMTEYRLRIIVVALWFLCLVITSAIILLIPAYAFSRSENPSMVAPVSVNGSTTSPAALHAQLLAQTANLSATLAALQASPSSSLAFTQIIPLIMAQKPEGISVTSITYTQGSSVQISGTAATRDELAAFQTALQNQASISDVSLPISDFAADTDIEFSMSITPSS